MSDGPAPTRKSRDSWDSAGVWGEAREHVRAEVQAAFRPKPRTCPKCGRTEETSAYDCPHCGASYVVMARKGLSPRARRIAAGVLALLLAVTAVALAIAVPRINSSKRADRARQAAEDRAFVARETKRLRADQAPHSARIPSGGRARVVASLERSIGADTRARIAAGHFKGPLIRTTCTRVGYGPYATGSARAGYECLAITGYVSNQASARAGSIGYPFWAIADFRRGTYTWCKTNPKAGERGVQSKEPVVPLSPKCDLHPGTGGA